MRCRVVEEVLVPSPVDIYGSLVCQTVPAPHLSRSTEGEFLKGNTHLDRCCKKRHPFPFTSDLCSAVKGGLLTPPILSRGF